MLDLAGLIGLYRQGCFPMGNPDGSLRIYRYDPRTILPLEQFRVPKRMARELKRHDFELTFDTDFAEVICSCAKVQRPREQGEASWINDTIVDLYIQAHLAGYAHSVEVRQEGKLVGGLYGVALGGAFFGESMFHLVPNASKVALIELVGGLRSAGFVLLDCQMATAHTSRFGTVDIPLSDYLSQLRVALELDCRFPPRRT